jgi:hypothetical protein
MRFSGTASIFIGTGLALAAPSLAPAQDSGQVVIPKEMPGFCRNLAIEQFAVQPKMVKVKKLDEGKGAFTVAGTIDMGTGVKRSFHCAFDSAGNFLQLVAETSEGE